MIYYILYKNMPQFRGSILTFVRVIRVSCPSGKLPNRKQFPSIREWSREGQIGGKHSRITIGSITKISELACYFHCVTTVQYVPWGELC